MGNITKECSQILKNPTIRQTLDHDLQEKKIKTFFLSPK